MGPGSIGLTEYIIIFIIIVFLFGAKRIPDLAKGIARSIREFKKASKEEQGEAEEDTEKE